MSVFEDAVRPFETPDQAGARPYVSQQGLTPQPYVSLTPGFGGDASGGLPPIVTGNASVSVKITFYMPQAANELSATEG